MTEEELRELFREMRDEPVPPDSQARVRLAVTERVRSWPERLRSHWKIAAAILVPACAMLIALLTREPAPPVTMVTMPQVQSASGVPAVEPAEPQNSASAAEVVRPVRRRAPAQRNRDEVAGTVIRIETPDPGVVILLVGG